MRLDDPVSNAYYIGAKYSELLKKLDIFTLKDLLYYYPIKYEDSRDIKMIENIVPKDINIVKGKIKNIKSIYTRSRKNMTTAEIEDDSGTADIIWFNQKYIINNIKIGDEIIIVGKTDIKKNRFIFIAPQFEVLKNTETVHFGRITPVYSQTKGISSKWLRSRIKTLLSNFDIEDDYLPLDIREKYNLTTIKDALLKLHFPNSFDDINKAKKRLGFEEILYIQIISYMRKQERERRSAYKISIDEEKIQEFISSLDFTLTNAQRRSINEIYMDIKRGIPMNRLLEGDVGSGKTIVAVIATYTMYLNNLQTAIMVPTSILAKQHYSSFKNYLEHKGVKVEIVTSKSKKIDKSASVFIGTQALLQDKDIFKKLGLIIIDEQHRFGVRQRENLISKGIDPHILTMTATPIPRTLALGIYGDLDISILDEKPEGRIDVKTYIVNDQKRHDAYNFIREKVKNGEQAFILCPLITESEKLQLKNVEEEYKILKNEVFQDLKVGLLHGKLKNKDRILKDFSNGDYDILVSTPVIEVGIDIKNATIIIIEDADRYGLAQLHQLRGRIGRSNKESYCLLFSSKGYNERLEFFKKNNNGLELAEFDLKKRGPGEIYGVHQSGTPDLKMASLIDVELIKMTKEAVADIIMNLDNYPKLKSKIREAQDKILQIN